MSSEEEEFESGDQGSEEEEDESESGSEESGDSEGSEEEEEGGGPAKGPGANLDQFDLINNDLDNLEIDIAFKFPGAGMSNYTSSYRNTRTYGNSPSYGGFKSSYQRTRNSKPAPRTDKYRFGLGGGLEENRRFQRPPRDLMTRREAREVRENELYDPRAQDSYKRSALMENRLGIKKGELYTDNIRTNAKNNRKSVAFGRTQDIGMQTTDTEFMESQFPLKMKHREEDYRKKRVMIEEKINPKVTERSYGGVGGVNNNGYDTGGESRFMRRPDARFREPTKNGRISTLYRSQDQRDMFDGRDRPKGSSRMREEEMRFMTGDGGRRGGGGSPSPRGGFAKSRAGTQVDRERNLYKKSIHDLYRRKQKPGN